MPTDPGASSFVTFRPLARGSAVARVLREKVSDYESEIIKNEVVAQVSAGIQRVAIDMSDVRFLTSAGIGALIHIDRACRAAGGRVVLFGLSDDLVGLLKISRLDKVFAIKSDEAAAIAALG